MDLFLVRHAIAVPRSDESLDHARPLTPKGRKRFARGVRGLDRLGVRLGLVLHSPWIRAVQTAELLDPINAGAREASEALAETPTHRLLESLKGDPVALVGHEPWIGELLGLLVFGDTAAGPCFPFKKGGVAHVRGAPAPAGCELLSFYPPRTLRMVAR